MKLYNIEIGKKLILDSMIYRVEANNRREAIKKVKTIGFNCGIRLSAAYKGEFSPIILDEIKQVKHEAIQ